VSEQLLCLVALGCRPCLATEPLAKGTSVDVVFPSYFRYILRFGRSQKRDRLIDRSHGCEDIACESALMLSCESVHEPGMCTSQGRLLELSNSAGMGVKAKNPLLLWPNWSRPNGADKFITSLLSNYSLD
jgi:hypothetical protein